MRSVIDILGMLACSVYGTIPLFWLAVHPFIDRWRKHGGRAYAGILPIWAVFIAMVFASMWPFRPAHLYATWWAWAPGIAMFAIGFSIYSAAFRDFRREQVSGLAELEPECHRQQLMTGGIRARVRHPIYLGHLCEILGWCIGTGLLGLYALAGFALITGALMIRIEDGELERRFGQEYRDYRSAVPAVIPRV